VLPRTVAEWVETHDGMRRGERSVSIAEFPSGPGSALDGGWTLTPEPAEYGGGGGGDDRTPPQDNNAEQSVLGSMLLSKDAIADVVESGRGTDV
jgi:hypothetical protein